MAGDGEHKMLFDLRGRRKNVVKVVYAILALLMGASLFVAVGPFNISELFSSNDANSSAAQFEDQAERLERKLVKDPENPDLLLNLARAQVNAGNALADVNPETGETLYTVDSAQSLQQASESWSKYLKATEEPSSSGAQTMSAALFSLAQLARSGPEAESNVQAAADAQTIVAKKRPSLGSLSTLAFYQLYSFDYDGAAKSRKQALAYANSKFERENLENEFDAIEKRAQAFEKQLRKNEKEAKKAREEGKPAVGNPLGESNPLGAP